MSSVDFEQIRREFKARKGNEADQVKVLTTLVTKEEAKNFRALNDSYAPDKTATKARADKETTDFLKSLKLTSGMMCALATFACKQVAASVMTPFNALELMKDRGYSVAVDVKMTKTGYTGVYTFIRGEHIVQVPAVSTYPNPTKLKELGFIVRETIESLVRVATITANYTSVARGVMKMTAIKPGCEAMLGYTREEFANFFGTIETLARYVGLFSEKDKILDGNELAHMMYLCVSKALANRKLRAVTIEYLKKVKIGRHSFIGSNNVFKSSMYKKVSGVDQVKIDHKNKTMDPKAGYACVLRMREMRGDNDSKRGQITRSSYTLMNMSGNDADNCTEAADLRLLLKGFNQIGLKADDPRQVSTLLKSLLLLNREFDVCMTFKPDRIQGVKKVDPDAVIVKKPEQPKPDEGTSSDAAEQAPVDYKGDYADMPALESDTEEEEEEKPEENPKKKRRNAVKTSKIFKYGKLTIYKVTTAFFDAGGCLSTKKKASDGVVIDRRGAAAAPSKLPASNDEFVEQLEELAGLKCPFFH